jgi:hypothetical protein
MDRNSFAMIAIQGTSRCYRCQTTESDHYGLDNYTKMLQCHKCALQRLMNDSTDIFMMEDFKEEYQVARKKLIEALVHLVAVCDGSFDDKMQMVVLPCERLMWMDAKSLVEYEDSNTLKERFSRYWTEIISINQGS